MLDLETIGYFLYMEKLEQEQMKLNDLRELVLVEDTEQDTEN